MPLNIVLFEPKTQNNTGNIGRLALAKESRSHLAKHYGFRISNNETFTQATKYAKVAIIGSAFVKRFTNKAAHTIDTFVDTILS